MKRGTEEESEEGEWSSAGYDYVASLSVLFALPAANRSRQRPRDVASGWQLPRTWLLAVACPPTAAHRLLGLPSTFFNGDQLFDG